MKKIVNGVLNLDPESKSRLKKLEGSIMNIELLPFNVMLHCKVENQQMLIVKGATEQAHATIHGTPLQFMGVMLDRDNRKQFFADDLVMEGNAEIAQQFTALFDELDIDWEELVSHVTGDEPAYHIGRTVRGIKSWVKRAGNSFTQNVSDYIHEEAEITPPPEALADFYDDIDELRMNIDRAEARVNKLIEKEGSS